MFLVLDEENNIIGTTQCERIKQQTENKVVELQDCPDNVVGTAKLIDGKIVYNDDKKQQEKS